MRMITKLADTLLGRVAPKARAEAACTGPVEEWCADGVLYRFTPCPRPRTDVIGTC
ncbi:hypothetical protein [Phytomonospora endophytica]|uniref:Uncharacterized protein n=1 Tax=Phytomonospora endophytica TaxID=714109 RepID=A0A841FSZ9_9ACTN|nr:hypothetical protein [Phytomonospora endophytica]MBB6039415.1 hypothetical protein [Phytomonospora endophytica]GIG70142.1 hypothetical protein Pen01_64370 [Phytomonospora endophytica]